MSTLCTVALDVLLLDADIQPRESMSSATIAEYAALYREGQALAPIVVFHHEQDYWVADGFHRVTAARQAGMSEIEAEVHQGTKREAIFYACGANKHGKPRTNEDKRRQVRRVLEDPEWDAQMNNSEVARHCGVDEKTVRKIRKELSSENPKIDTPIRQVTRNGTTYTMDTTNIGTNGSPALDTTSDEDEEDEWWECPRCLYRWTLTRDACGWCGTARPFEYFPTPPGATVIWNPVSLDHGPVQASHAPEEADDITRADSETTFRAPLRLVSSAPSVPKGTPTPTFNRTNEMVDWAKWTWNPVTGCLHTCVYCYARDIATRHYPQGFAPTFHPERLKAPHYTKVPVAAETQVGERNVFVCSMADLFGKWVPDEWIDAVMTEVRAAPQWNFLFLTKFPQRLESIAWPHNAWVGTTVDEQYRVSIAEKAFRNVNAPVKWLSCEPLRERLTFTSLTMFDWVVVGGQSRSSQAPAFQPPWEWVEHLWQQARDSRCMVYWKPNLTTRPQEYPGKERNDGH